MNLHSPSPYWRFGQEFINSYPSLTHDVKTDIAIIGVGISGAPGIIPELNYKYVFPVTMS